MKRVLFTVRRESPEGFVSETQVARGDDGSFWMEPAYLEVTPAEVEALRRKEPWSVEREPRSGRLFVEMMALMRNTASEERMMELYLLASEHLGLVARDFPTKWDLM